MARFTTLLMLFGLLGSNLVGAVRSQEELDEMNKNSECDNDCFSDSFPGNSCAGTKACMCTEQKYRERYFCCLATKCAPTVLPDSVIRQTNECDAKAIPFTFDSEAACGVKMSDPSDYMTTFISNASTSKATSTVESSSSKETKSADATSTEAKSSDEAKSSGASSASPASSKATDEASSTAASSADSTGSQTSSGTSTPTPTETGSAGNKVMAGSAALFVAAAGALLL